MPTAANQIWPHLKTDERPMQQRRTPSLADAMYPSLVPQPQPPAPKPRMTREEAFDWSGVDECFARACGLIPKEKG